MLNCNLFKRWHKNVQENVSIISVRYGWTSLSLGSLFGITRQSLVMPNSDHWDRFFSHIFVEKIEKSINLLPVCKLYPTLLALLSHTASLVAYEG